jgi:hypothetical protein
MPAERGVQEKWNLRQGTRGNGAVWDVDLARLEADLSFERRRRE